nr:hypothetical protein [Lysinibacillus timonensis]
MKLLRNALLGFLVVILSACGTESITNIIDSEESPITEFTNSVTETVSSTTGILENASEVFNFIQQSQGMFQEIMNISGEWNQLMNDVTNGNITNNEFVAIISDEVLPLNEELKAQIDNLAPPTDTTAFVNEILKTAVTTQEQALLEVVNGIQNGELSVLDSANQMMTDVNGLEVEFTNLLDSLTNEYGF